MHSLYKNILLKSKQQCRIKVARVGREQNTEIVEIRYQETTGQDTTDWGDIACAVVKFYSV
jgi:hypothetical protein